ncbi:lipopolysaccharide-induced tumor necrosis factor-alpha factor homolog isoform X2 [Pseudorasbora parva]|uniref:lipopolysaccharide-induced tumor necrosis factor-alpha factor homolog isoform X2 n=1 Tax=Pseudorasbora parva TaxID=51549 RepID=UPI00351DAC0F
MEVTASGCTSLPPDYNNIHLYEEIPATPPPSYATAIASPAYRETNNGQEMPQNPNERRANPYPVLNVPPQIAMVRQEQMLMQQEVRAVAVAPQVIMVQPQQRVVVFGDTPTVTVCQYCHKSIITNVEYKPGSAAWGMCLLLTLLGLICGFCLIPFFVKGFQDAHHTCPSCHRHLGIYNRK